VKNDYGGNIGLSHCAKCHAREGEGFLKLYPPIHDSAYLKENVSKHPCIIRNGLKGKITIGEITFNHGNKLRCILPTNHFLLSEEDAKEISGYFEFVIRDYWDEVCEEALLSKIDKKLLWGRRFLNPFSFEK